MRQSNERTNPIKVKRAKGDRYYNDTAFRYNKKRERQEWWHVEQAEMQALLDMLPKNLSVVDIPFGTGRFVPYYLERGYKIFGLDASNDMLLAAQKALGSMYEECICVTGDAAKLPFADDQFDLVVSTRFLRDIIPFAQSKKMIAEMSRVTSEYAIIQLGENTSSSRMPSDDEVMGSKLSRDALEDYLAEFKFTVVERRLVKTLDDGEEIYHLLMQKG